MGFPRLEEGKKVVILTSRVGPHTAPSVACSRPELEGRPPGPSRSPDRRWGALIDTAWVNQPRVDRWVD